MNNVEPPRRSNPDKELIDFFSDYKHTGIIVFDLETNGFQGTSVLSISGIKLMIENSKLVTTDTYNRFYFPVEEYNKGATDVNGLTKEVVEKKRTRVSYPEHFKDDPAFLEFCKGITHIVGHNAIKFDSTFIAWETPIKIFDTMIFNSDVVCKEWWTNKGTWKFPKLMETAIHFGIEVEENNLHGSLYDTEITTKVFMKNFNEAVRNGSLIL